MFKVYFAFCILYFVFCICILYLYFALCILYTLRILLCAIIHTLYVEVEVEVLPLELAVLALELVEFPSPVVFPLLLLFAFVVSIVSLFCFFAGGPSISSL
jgi:hypothetical protein